MTFLDFAIIGAVLVFTLAIGLYMRRRASQNPESFFAGGRNLPWYLLGVSMVATTFGADTPLAVTEMVYANGISGNWLWWNFLAGSMLTTFLFAALWRRSGVLTDNALIEMRYSGKPAKWLRTFRAVYLGVFLNAIVIGWVNKAFMSLLEVFFGLEGWPLVAITFGAMLLVAGYASLSGLLGVVYTDFFQFLLAMGGTIALAVVVVRSPEIGGMDALLARLPEGTTRFLPSLGSAEGLTGLSLGLGSFLAFVGFQWWASWYPGFEPGGGGYIAQRIFAARSEGHAVKATLLFQLAHYCLRPWPWIVVGLCVVVLYPDLGDDARLGYVMVMKDFLPPGLMGLLLAAFFAAYLSTISTQLNWGASYLSHDVVDPLLKDKGSNAVKLRWARLNTFLLMVVSMAVTLVLDSISGAWLFLVETGAGLGLVLILRWLWWRINAWSEIAATAAPVAGYAIAHFLLGLEFPNRYFFTIGFTTVVWVVVTLLTPPESKSTLEAFAAKVRPMGWWRPVVGHNAANARLPWLLLAWWGGVALAYGLLFATGSFLLGATDQLILYAALTVVGVVSLAIANKKAKIFE